VSEANWRLAEKQIGGELHNAEVVRNPFNGPYDAPPPWPTVSPEHEIRFACVGRLDPRMKGYDILFEAFGSPSWKSSRWQLSMFGKGDVREGTEWLARKYGLADHVVFPGFRPVEEIWAAHHVLVMPSRFEGLPLAIVEAMLCARPVIATDVGGHAEVLEDGVTGFLADAPTVASVARALERFWESRDQAEVIGRAGAARIRELVPPDPAHVFAEKLKRLAGLEATK
jgi:glycosyltransferase involved in cell wall biosynthesis